MGDSKKKRANEPLTSALRRSLLRRGGWLAAKALAAAALLIFLSSGMVAFWEGWAYLVLLALLWAGGLYYFLHNATDLIRRRLRPESCTKTDILRRAADTVRQTLFPLLLIVPGLDHRFLWAPPPPDWASAAALAACAVGLWIAFYAAAYNEFMDSVVSVDRKHTVIALGPYARVRHPLYTGLGIWLFFTPLALGSWWGLAPAVLVPIVLAARLAGEERRLHERLPGYAAYCARVRWRLIPYVF